MRNFKDYLTSINQKVTGVLAKKHISYPLRVLNILQWLVVPLLIFITAENLLKKVDEEKPQWYPAAELVAKNHEVDYVFIGSSRVAAAIQSRVFMDGMSAYTGQKKVALNLGLGYSTIQQHYLGMRNLFEKYPNSFKHVTVFFEAPGGIVNYYYFSKWSYDWVNSGRTQLLIPVLKDLDLWHFLLQSSENINTKVYVVFKYYFNRFKLIRFRERVKERIDNKVQEWMEKKIMETFHLQPAEPQKKLDLTDSGGVQVKAKNPTEYKAEGVRMVDEELGRLRLRFYWNTTVLGELVDMIRAHHGKIVFFKMPVASIRNRVYVTQIHKGNLAIFKDWLKKWESTVLIPDFKYNDEDFPDFSHLRFSRSAEYTEKVREAYVEYLKKK